VTVSIPPQAFLVGRVGGPRVAVSVLAGPGEDSHTYEPSDMQVSEVLRSRVYFRIGVPFENGKWLSALAGSMRIVDLRDGLTLRHMAEGESVHEGHSEGSDPHVWLSTRALLAMSGTIAEVLAAEDPGHAGEYRANRAALAADIEAAAAEVRGVLAPVAGRPLYVFHPAWGYFADEFGLKQVSIEFEGKEPSDREMTEIISRARADRVRVIFVQPQITGRSARAIAESVGARLEVLDPLKPEVLDNLRESARRIAEALK
jgi:zinc transport system substrate-binding protein